ncbi:F0F1 ATP synthase subunit epsilon [Vallicoccus soli]|uniref:ATP synthase epsilon chain n=1 Tax=Vallicoccus soli TaxID=2339232 RepID=A0A3A3Z4W4_9ACTN|nr:F0F1 ATP synthase subunit epsilon [Vallicoccus soli]RJK98444.1 F0F1 ATP synthase subunit epsilon [Vallicoccus soli]
MQVELVAPDRYVWSGPATMVVAKTSEGDLGVLPGHAPLLAVLVNGRVEIRPVDGEPVVVAVLGGFLSVADDKVSLLAEAAELAEEISVAEAEQALREAEGQGDADAAARARARLSVAGGR